MSASERHSPNALTAEQTCATCENVVDMDDVKAAVGAKPPWHFWLMVVALVAYLGWRAVEAVLWAVGAV